MPESISPERQSSIYIKPALHLAEIVVGAGFFIDSGAAPGSNLLKIPLGVAGLVIFGRGLFDIDGDLKRLSQMQSQDSMPPPVDHS